jgi:hypothetical protein
MTDQPDKPAKPAKPAAAEKRGRRPRFDRLRRIGDLFPFTIAGLFVIAASLFATLYYGLERLDHILLAVGVVGLALAAVSFLSVMIAALIAWRSARAAVSSTTTESLLLECGHVSPTGFKLRVPRIIPFVDVRWSWLEPTAEVVVKRVKGHLAETIKPEERDHFTTVIRRIEIRDVFGIVRFAFRIKQSRNGRFSPWVGGLERMHVAHGMSGGADLTHPDGTPVGDFYDMRRYGAGDPIRFILWKVFARTRELLVRTPEIAISPDRRTVAYLVAGTGDEPAAGAARIAVDSGALGAAWVLGADGCEEDATNSREEAMDVLAKSRRASDEESGRLGEFLGRVSKGSTTRAVVFVPAYPGPWIDRVIAATAAPAGQLPRVEFVVCTDGIGDMRTKRSVIARAAMSAPKTSSAAAVHEDLLAVVDRLGKTGANVLVVDRPRGRLVPGKHLRGVG